MEIIGGEGRLRFDSVGDYVCWSGVNMNGVNGVRARHANGELAGDQLAVRYEGAVLGLIDVLATGSWHVEGDASVNFAPQTGTGTLCIEASSNGAGWVAMLNNITLLR